MFFHVSDPGVPADEEAVDPVVLGILRAAVVDAASGHNDHVGIGADVEIVVNQLFQSAFGHHHGDMYAFVFCAGQDADIQTAHVGFRGDFDMGGGLSSGGTAVGTDVVGAFRHLVQIGHLPQQPLLDLVEL